MGSIQSNHSFIPFIITVKNTTQEKGKKRCALKMALLHGFTESHLPIFTLRFLSYKLYMANTVCTVVSAVVLEISGFWV